MSAVVEKIDELPVGWEKTTLGELVEYVTSGSRGWKKYYADEGALFIRTQDIKYNALSKGDIPRVNLPEKVEGKRTLVKKGDLLITITGYIGRVASIDREVEEAYVSQSVALARLKNPDFSKFIQYQLLTKQGGGTQLENMAYGMGRPVLNLTNIKDVEIKLPNLEQQKRIVAKIEELFSHINAGIEALKKAKQLLKQYRQSVLKAAVNGELTKEWREANKDKLDPASQLLERILKERRQKWEEQQLKQFKTKGKMPKDDKWKEKYIEPEAYENGSYEAPDSWIMVRAEQVCEFITKGTTPKKEKLSAGKGEVPFVKVYNLTFDTSLNFDVDPTFTDSETHEGFLARSKVYPGDVLMNIVGPPLGKISIVSNLYDEWNINQAIAVYRTITGLNNKLLAYFLLSKPVVEWMLSKTKTTAGQVNLTLEISRNAPIPIMPIEEQLEIVRLVEEKLASSDRLLEELSIQQIKAEKNKQSILASAFSGKLLNVVDQLSGISNEIVKTGT